VFLNNGDVYKFYDTKDDNVNYEVIQKLGDSYLPGMKKVELSTDGRFVLLQYDYMEEKDDDSIEAEDFKPLIRALDCLHNSNIIHGDIRRCNLLFPEHGDANIIDFDLANTVDSQYIQGYNHSGIRERHPDAKEY